ncbi:hypothetical protein TBK1r_63530 [Stieleria magnilauensis]|uniref:Uncharacterized protein n=1 Tax=Stieleria magnilauensis TaxID=2527963 RepID=A0ABX5XZ58_9BACT|nr:hypothetical protein TBK1r_63530 [Planctomycetes bacterium TBK1r]
MIQNQDAVTRQNSLRTEPREVRKAAPGQPGTLGEMLACIVLSIQYGERTETSAAQQWEKARSVVLGRADAWNDDSGRGAISG